MDRMSNDYSRLAGPENPTDQMVSYNLIVLKFYSSPTYLKKPLLM